MKKFWLKCGNRISTTLKWFLIVAVFAIAVPIGIDIAYKRPSLFPVFDVAWEAKDALAFYGSLLGAVATIFALRMTILFTRENQKEERRLSIMPYLETHKSEYKDIDNIPDAQGIIYLRINKDLITYQGALPEDISDLKRRQIELDAGELEPVVEGAMLYAETVGFFDENCVLLYEIENCGGGNAVNVNFKINNKDALPNFCITTTLPKKFVLIFNKDLLGENNKCELSFSISYSDVSSLGKYIQEESIIFYSNSKGELKTKQTEKCLLHKPVQL